MIAYVANRFANHVVGGDDTADEDQATAAIGGAAGSGMCGALAAHFGLVIGLAHVAAIAGLVACFVVQMDVWRASSPTQLSPHPSPLPHCLPTLWLYDGVGWLECR